MGENARYYHIWKKGTPVEKSLAVRIIGNSVSAYSISADDWKELERKIGFTINSGNPTVNEKYNINKISENRVFRKLKDYQRGINLPDLN